MRWGSRGVGPAFVAAWVAGCGGGGPSTPTPPVPTPPSGVGAGSALTVVSGETGAPIAGVSVNTGGQTFTTDDTGQVRLPNGAPFGTPVDFVHPAYLDRQTSVRAGVTRFALWPRTSPTGVNEHYTATLVYTYASNDPPSATGSTPLIRLARGTTQVVVVPSPEILADGLAMEQHYRAVEAANAATGGEVVYALAPSRPAAGVIFESRVDPTIPQCVSRTALAIMQGTYRNLELTGGAMIFCDIANARTHTVTHEIGHTLGFQHSPDIIDVMGTPFTRSRSAAFGPREALAVHLMMQRSAGNRFPDTDRGAAAADVTTERVTVCR
jgi:hypothetical protein